MREICLAIIEPCAIGAAFGLYTLFVDLKLYAHNTCAVQSGYMSCYTNLSSMNWHGNSYAMVAHMRCHHVWGGGGGMSGKRFRIFFFDI